jgi:hypothetical protein
VLASLGQYQLKKLKRNSNGRNVMKKVFCILILFLKLVSASGQQGDSTSLDGVLPEGVYTNPDEKYNQKIESLQKNLDIVLDGASKFKVKDARLSYSMDSLKNKLDSLKKIGPAKDIKQAEQQLTKLQNGINVKVVGLEKKIDHQLNALNGSGENRPMLSLPDVKVPQLNILSSVNEKISDLDNKLNPNLVGGPSVSSLNLPQLQNKNLLPVNTSIKDTGVDGLNLNKISDKILSDGSTQLKDEVGQTGKVMDEAGRVAKEVKSLKKDDVGKLSGDFETEVENSEAMKQLKQEEMQAEQYKKMAEKWQSDPQYRKEMMLNKAKEQGINHFAGHDKELSAAMQKLSGMKRKYKDVGEVIDMFKKPENSMKGKSFAERILPGFNLQVQSRHDVLIDLNPQIGYKISGRLTMGAGWNERWGFDFRNWKYHSTDLIYGPRVYGQFKIKAGIYALAVPEVMRTLVTPTFLSPDLTEKKWVWSYIVGMKKEFRATKGPLGNIQVMYNIYDPKHQSLYARAIVRIGFDFPYKNSQDR